MGLTKEQKVLVQIVREAGKVSGKTLFAKMVCYLQKERGEKLGYEFDGKFPQGHYTLEFDKDLKLLVDGGIISENKIRIPFSGTGRIEKFEYELGPKRVEAGLPEKTVLKVRSIVREYGRVSSTDISNYDHELYVNKSKSRGSFELKKHGEEETKHFLEKTGNDPQRALELFLKEKEREVAALKKAGSVA